MNSPIPRPAGAAVALLASTPFVVQYARMVDAPPFSAAFLGPGALAWFAWREAPSRGRGALWFALALLGGLTDWFGYFLFVPVAIDALAGDGKRLPRLVRAAAPFALAATLVAAWMLWAAGSLEAWWTQVRTLGSAPGATRGMDAGWGPWAEAMKSALASGFGTPLLVAASLGLLVTLRRLAMHHATRLDRAQIAALVAGLLPVVAFRDRAAAHEFFLLPAAWGMAALAATGVTAIGGLVPRGARPAAIVAIAATMAVFGARDGVTMHGRYAADAHVYPDRARDVDAHVTPRDVVIRPDGFSPENYYTECGVVHEIRRRDDFLTVLRGLAPARMHIDRIFFLRPHYYVETDDHLMWVRSMHVIRKPDPDNFIRYAGNWSPFLELDAPRLFDELE